MFPNRFAIILFIRVVFISLISLLFIYFLTETQKPATALFFFILLIYSTGSLFHYIKSTNRELANFIICLKENDTTVAFNEERLERTFKGLSKSFEKVKQHFYQVRLENEIKQHFLQAIVAQVGTGLVCFDQSGKVKIFNQALSEIIGIASLHNIHKLNNLNNGLGDKMFSIKPGEQVLLKFNKNNDIMQLAIKASVIKVKDIFYRILSIQNIKEELEEKEIDSWKKLIGVFTHEIMNSITPITTITATIKRNFSKNGSKKTVADVTPGNIDDAHECAEIIEERSKGVISFVEGIGLSISRQIVRMHRGSLFLSTNDKKETVFTIRLPLKS